MVFNGSSYYTLSPLIIGINKKNKYRTQSKKHILKYTDNSESQNLII